MNVNLGNIIPVSTVDWHGRSSCTIFFNNCNFRCPTCQNYKLLDNKHLVDIEYVEKNILDAKMFISAVVFSGGEPTVQFDALTRLAKFAKRQELLVGIQTNGYFSERLKELVNGRIVDKIYLDVKADPLNAEKYSKITGGIRDASYRVIQSLHIPDVVIEARTTIFRSFNDAVEIAKYLEEHGYDRYIIQQGISYRALDDKIRKEDILTRNEMIAIAKNIVVGCGLDIKIMTMEKGEEDVININSVNDVS